ncbi:MAG: hypothetical protein CVT75_03405 [Alphaproteobacteria bacterium HGW-Alphaproteobacteria-14]|nr:MAG: hypothetical protein CVT75_03405 [Alphaproteobacteria bacterium HGW-Alphaproteobacteria-14]
MSIQTKDNLELRAVQAAEASVVQADRAVDVSIASAAISVVAFIALLITILQGRAALRRAAEANTIASDSMKRQLRAYLSVEPHGVQIPEPGWISVPISMENNGNTPATDLEVAGDVILLVGDPREFNPATDGRITDETLTSENAIGPHVKRFHYAKVPDDFIGEHRMAIHSGDAAIVHYGWIAYTDVFGDRHRTNFAFYHRGPELNDVESKRCRFGNNAT